VELRPTLGANSAATSIPGRLILLDASVLARHGEFERILVHEIFHFAWVHLSNAARRSWEEILRAEMHRRVSGELGWSAEWRKLKLHARDARERSPAWRRYACESFCDTAAWMYAGLGKHDEFTLNTAARPPRRAWFALRFSSGVQV